jgi:hypothetical protein
MTEYRPLNNSKKEIVKRLKIAAYAERMRLLITFFSDAAWPFLFGVGLAIA